MVTNTYAELSDTVTLYASAKDNGFVSKYLWSIDSGKYFFENQDSAFSCVFNKVGRNIVLVKALDNDGNFSPIDTTDVFIFQNQHFGPYQFDRNFIRKYVYTNSKFSIHDTFSLTCDTAYHSKDTGIVVLTYAGLLYKFPNDSQNTCSSTPCTLVSLNNTFIYNDTVKIFGDSIRCGMEHTRFILGLDLGLNYCYKDSNYFNFYISNSDTLLKYHYAFGTKTYTYFDTTFNFLRTISFPGSVDFITTMGLLNYTSYAEFKLIYCTGLINL
jgi:hypothetical protein